MKYYIASIEEQIGERENWTSVVLSASSKRIALEKLDKTCQFWLDEEEGGQKLADGEWEFDGGGSIVTIGSMREIPLDHYHVLKEYLYVC